MYEVRRCRKPPFLDVPLHKFGKPGLARYVAYSLVNSRNYLFVDVSSDHTRAGVRKDRCEWKPHLPESVYRNRYIARCDCLPDIFFRLSVYFHDSTRIYLKLDILLLFPCMNPLSVFFSVLMCGAGGA